MRLLRRNGAGQGAKATGQIAERLVLDGIVVEMLSPPEDWEAVPTSPFRMSAPSTAIRV